MFLDIEYYLKKIERTFKIFLKTFIVEIKIILKYNNELRA